MCGIVGYSGTDEAAEILLEGLKKLEYRGYDSSGIAVVKEDGFHCAKKAGRILALETYMQGHAMSGSTCGIGHTRWATHGEPSDENAHPHFNKSMTIGLVHNGIIENFIAIKDKMERRGYTFLSETDSEVIVHMLDYYDVGDHIATIQRVLSRLRGSYALEIIFADEPGFIYCVRKDSPLVIGAAEDGIYVASDAPAILAHTRTVYYPENNEIAVIGKNRVLFYNEDSEIIQKEEVYLGMDENAAEKGAYEHFMMKEIEEQPEAIRNLLSRYGASHAISGESKILKELVGSAQRIRIVACGSAYHAGIAAKYVFESLAQIPVEVELASEFRYRNPVFTGGELVMILSQSGETADSLAALRETKERGIPVLAIVNVEGSSIAREADAVLYTCAGPEISVATTKGYSTQLVMLDLIAAEMSVLQGRMSEKEYEDFIDELKKLPEKIIQILESKKKIQKIANYYAHRDHAFFIGRGLDYATAMEGALKLKEISYIHAEAYAAGELKHGTIALIEENSLVVAIETQPELYEKVKSNVIETKSRGARIFAVGFVGSKDAGIEEIMDDSLVLPECMPLISPSLAIIPFQLFAYYVSAAKGIDVDKPRNLAKSVTVE